MDNEGKRLVPAKVALPGAVREQDPEGHPRRVMWENLAYVRRHQGQMDYPRYRAKGWPIGSGVTESGVKLFNKRVKGTEQFWNEEGAETILALRALLLSQDDRWDHYWLCGRLRRQAAQEATHPRSIDTCWRRWQTGESTSRTPS